VSKKHRARGALPAGRKGLRRVHILCVALVALAGLSWWAGLRWPAPVPLDGEHEVTTLGVAAALTLACIGLAFAVLNDLEDRLVFGFTAMVICTVLSGTSLPDLVYALNASDQEGEGAQTTLITEERFVSSEEHSPAKRRRYHVLRTQTLAASPGSPPPLVERRISREQYEALSNSALIPGQAMTLHWRQGRLGWPYIQAIDTSAQQ
jgi:hypothetical protein